MFITGGDLGFEARLSEGAYLKRSARKSGASCQNSHWPSQIGVWWSGHAGADQESRRDLGAKRPAVRSSPPSAPRMPNVAGSGTASTMTSSMRAN